MEVCGYPASIGRSRFDLEVVGKTCARSARLFVSLVKFVFLRCACVRVPRAGSNLPPKPTYSPGQELFNEAFPEETGGRLPQFRPSFAHRD